MPTLLNILYLITIATNSNFNRQRLASSLDYLALPMRDYDPRLRETFDPLEPRAYRQLARSLPQC